MCWGTCPEGTEMCPKNSGLLCLEKGVSCGSKIAQMAAQVVKNLIKAALMGSSAVANPAEFAKELLTNLDSPLKDFEFD